MTTAPLHVAVIGAGIVGVAIAAELLDAGHSVTLIDRDAPGSGASRANAGQIATATILPFASPSVWRSAPRWLIDPTGPLAVRPGHLPALLPWLLRFAIATTPGRVRRSTVAQADLMSLTWPATDRLYGRAGIARSITRGGGLYLYDSEKSLRHALSGWAVREAHGIDFEILEPAALRDRVPPLARGSYRGVFVPDFAHVDEPFDVVSAIAAHCRDRGAAFAHGAVEGIAPGAGTVRLSVEDGDDIAADRVIVAAGAWSKPLAAVIGDRVPLDTERGYNTTIPEPGIDVPLPLILADRGFVMTPLVPGLRIGGAVEFAGLTAPPNFTRARVMLEIAKTYLPDLNIAGGAEWMGLRPSLPDTLPVIGPSPHDRRVLYAFGHGHLGLTQAPATAVLIRHLIDGRTPPIDLTPFAIERFR